MAPHKTPNYHTNSSSFLESLKGTIPSQTPLFIHNQNMSSNTSDLHHEALEIKQYDKFSSRLLSREEASITNPSFRVYYGGATGAVPFVWESQPGMPKSAITTTTRFPPLTPPPSYQSNKIMNCTKKSPKITLIHNILPRLTLRRNRPPSPPPSLSSVSSSSSCMTSAGSHRGSRLSSSRKSLSSQGDEEDNGSPRSILCFGMRRSY